MGRRRGTPAVGCFTGKQLEAAKLKVVELRRNHIEAVYPIPFKWPDVIAACYDEADVAFGHEAFHRLVNRSVFYSKSVLEGVNLIINWELLETVPPAAKPKVPDWLASHCAKVQGELNKFIEIVTMLKWFAEHGKPSTIQHYWPAGAALIPELPPTTGRVTEIVDKPIPVVTLRKMTELLTTARLCPPAPDEVPYEDVVSINYNSVYVQRVPE